MDGGVDEESVGGERERGGGAGENGGERERGETESQTRDGATLQEEERGGVARERGGGCGEREGEQLCQVVEVGEVKCGALLGRSHVDEAAVGKTRQTGVGGGRGAATLRRGRGGVQEGNAALLDQLVGPRLQVRLDEVMDEFARLEEKPRAVCGGGVQHSAGGSMGF